MKAPLDAGLGGTHFGSADAVVTARTGLHPVNGKYQNSLVSAICLLCYHNLCIDAAGAEIKVAARRRHGRPAYLDWEVALVEQIKRDPTIRFRSYD